ncbi:[acyl-carrier-protein] S-malonyltransferase [Burkholderia cepacia]|uniref:[acyl-carrier-protein] S-malonyltransferase n=1 Tax=Burkholderia cepacia TaxID=292 RepID=A0A2S8HZI4_BURCE|nr:ACP S-malonyltransferase [Burkholderia cepacia]PQP07839.1 [acyl-carrier-protein] S-malonyltransferase [Burkholderia cepacia]HDR9511996.1 ACP S-malonyltransferase [Burkholderia cepacia]
MNVLLFPGQGAQYKGMGQDLWAAYPRLVDAASHLLGYSIADLCLHDPHHQLRLTQYTQPALYVLNALGWYRWQEAGGTVDALAGHSLGEYSALLVAGCFDFETGLRLVQKRGQLMGEARGGAMAAVLGMSADALQTFLREHGLDSIDLANLNSPTQSVIAGDTATINQAAALLVARDVQCVPLNVSAPFHSRYMREVQQVFATFLRDFTFQDPVIPVIANATARPYGAGQVAELLARQIASPVWWTDSIRYLMGQDLDFSYQEIGADPKRIGGTVLGKLVDETRRTATPLRVEPDSPTAGAVEKSVPDEADMPTKRILASRSSGAQCLGSAIFRERYGLKYAYVAGAMYRGTASPALVIRLGRAGMIGYLGTGGLSLTQIEAAIQTVQAELRSTEPYGLNLLADYEDPANERATVELYLKYGVRCIEAAAFTQMTPALVLFRLKGLSRDATGQIQCAHRVLAKVSRLEVAEAFMSPAPAPIVEALRQAGAITAEQAAMAQQIPMSHDICVEADSGGHTDGGIPTILLPAMLQLRQKLSEHRDREPICMGLAGGIGAPAAAAAAFAMGADFILTGSINQCTVESGATDLVKAMLQDAGIHDTAYAPAGDLFEMGSRVQVLKKGVLFPMRANKLYALYTHYDSLEAIPETVRGQLERNFFKRSLGQVWDESLHYLQAQGRAKDIALAQSNPKVRMARVFRWYFRYSTELAFSGSADDRVNYQVHTGPALGAFNQWVRGTEWEPWNKRHVDAIAIALMDATAQHQQTSYTQFLTAQKG